MSKVEIYYFTGTGNSLVVARDIAGKTNGKLIPVISLLDIDKIDTDAEVVGIVFPIYDCKPPHVISEFIKKLSDIDSKYIFAVGTYGVIPLKAMKMIETEIKTCGGQLAAGFLVEMPHNALGYKSISAEVQRKLFDDWRKKLETINEYVSAQQTGCVETSNILFNFVLSGVVFKALPSLFELLWYVLRNGWEALKFVTDEKCSGCGTCMRICPMNNIRLEQNKPVWSNNCAMCFACLQWCPREAIQSGSVTVNMKRYHHPDVKLTDMMRKDIRA